MKAKRYNKGKIRYELIPEFALKDVAEVYTKGAHKYSMYKKDNGDIIKGSEIPFKESFNYELIEDGSSNWRLGLPWMDMIASVERHIRSFKQGEDIDPDLGTKHLANATWGLLGILEYYKIAPQFDNRELWYKKPFKRVYLDLDGVCAAFEEHFLEYFDLPRHHPKDWNDPRFRDNIHKITNNEEFWMSCPALIKGEELTYPITGYCTARDCSVDTVRAWLDKNDFPSGEIINVGPDQSKIEALKSKCDVMVDDSIRNFVELNSNGIECYLMSRPHNMKYDVGYRRVNNIKEFINKLK